MDWELILGTFAFGWTIGLWTSGAMHRAARVRSARKAAKTRAYNKYLKEQAKDFVNDVHKAEK